MSMTKTAVAATIALLSGAAPAATITQWNFNSVPADASTTTGTTVAALGAGSVSLVGGTTATFASGAANGGSSDPEAADDSGWNLTAFAAQGSGNQSRGAQFLVSTVGWQDISISYDLRHSNTSAANEVVQVTFDGGASFTDVAGFTGNAGDTWFNGRTVDLSSFAAADDNALFGIRIVAGFGPGGSYVASSPTGTYGSSGTWRFDMVTVSALAPVPEPAGLALLLAGVGVLALRRRPA